MKQQRERSCGVPQVWPGDLLRHCAAGFTLDLAGGLVTSEALPLKDQPKPFGRQADARRKLSGLNVLARQVLGQRHGYSIQHYVGLVNNMFEAWPTEWLSYTLVMPRGVLKQPPAPALAARRAFAQRLVAARRLAGYDTQEAAAAALGMPEAETYRRWERAETEPSIAILLKICNVFNVTADQLIRGTVPIRPRALT